MSERQFREILDRYLSGTATPAERELLDKFFESYTDSGEEADRPPNAVLSDEMLRRIHDRVAPTRRRGQRLISLWLSMAAMISVFVVAYFFVSRSEEQAGEPQPSRISLLTEETGPTERLVKTLPDGTIVHINNNSRISYPREFGNDREVAVEGEVFFDVVTNGKPFIVTSGHVKTKVSGTSFNVRYDVGHNTEVTLVEGRVRVVSASRDSVVLRPGQQAVASVDQGVITKRAVNVLRYTGWKDKLLLFEQTPLEEAVAEIERWYGVRIDIVNPSIRHCAITAKYHDEPVGNVLSSLQFLLELQIRRVEDKHYEIDGKRCR